jgi:hypothetical protein
VVGGPAIPAFHRFGEFVTSVHATLGRGSLQIPEADLQELGRGEQQKDLALFHGQPQPDEGTAHGDHSVPRHCAEVRTLTAPDPLPRNLETFLRESPDRGMGTLRLIVVHPQRVEFIGHPRQSPPMASSRSISSGAPHPPGGEALDNSYIAIL